MSLPQRPLSPDEGIRHWISTGWYDDEIVERLLKSSIILESGERIYPDPPGRRRLLVVIQTMRGGPSPDAVWLEIVEAYRRLKQRRPTQLAIASEMGFSSEDPVRDRLRSLGIPNRWVALRRLLRDVRTSTRFSYLRVED